ncbi:hypothetical protein V2J09_023105 [Rumex salicifolius]
MSLCGGRVVGSMTLPSVNPTRKSGDAASDQFPAGLRVLVVDDDPTCLKILERMLHSCQYEVTKCDRAEYALNELRRNKNGFDVVISDVHMPDMDGFKLLEHVGLEMDLPVIMMSADDSKSVVMKGVVHGACDYLIKPVRMEALKNIWQHVVRKKKQEWKDVEQSGSFDDGDRAPKQDDAEYSSSMNDGNWKSTKRKVEDEEAEDRDDTASMKKPRVVWSVELHQQFVVAVNQLGIDKAVPKKILELMNVPGLTRENVASHLQKYRLYLRRLSGVSHHQGVLTNPFMSPQDPGFGTMSPLPGFDLQTLAVAGQLRGSTLSGYQPGLSRSTIKPGVSSMPSFIDQRNPFNLETPKLRFAEGQHIQHLSNTANKQINLLHGIPTTMELKQLGGFHHQNAQTLGSQGNSLLVPMVQPHTTSGQLNERNIGSQISQIQSSMRQTMSSSGSSSRALPRTGSAESNRAIPYCSASSSSAVDFSVNHVPDMSFPIGSTPALSTSKGLIRAEVSSNLNGPSGFSPNYDVFNQLSQQKPQDWQSSSLNYGAPQHSSSATNNMNVTQSIMLNNQGFSSRPDGNDFAGNTPVISTGIEVLQLGSNTQISNFAHVDNFSARVKTERIQEPSSGYPYQFADDDLMSAILKQQEGIGSVEGEFDFDGYTLDNISV